jgi:hypothetical protein
VGSKRGDYQEAERDDNRKNQRVLCVGEQVTLIHTPTVDVSKYLALPLLVLVIVNMWVLSIVSV